MACGARTELEVPQPRPSPTPMPPAVSALAAGVFFSCALLRDQTVKCWGDNEYGQLGDGTLGGSSVPVSVMGVGSAVAIAAGDYHACALLADGTAVCWGANDYGQLGGGSPLGEGGVTIAPRKVPAAASVVGLSGIRALAAGAAHTCALLADATVACWGADAGGELGTPLRANTSLPTLVPGVSGVAEIAAGGETTCARLANGTVQCWGLDFLGEVGNSAASDQCGAYLCARAPLPVVGIDDARAVAVGADFSCALRPSAELSCWGSNAYGKLGTGSINYPSSLTPQTVLNLHDAVSATLGSYHACVLRAGGSAACWGDNVDGQIGDGIAIADNAAAEPQTVAGIAHVTALVAGGYHTCAVVSGARVFCWGSGHYGQLGSTAAHDSCPGGIWGPPCARTPVPVDL